MKNNEKFEIVITKRKELEMSQTEFAKAIGVSRTTVANWESQKAMPTESNLEKIMALEHNLNPQEKQNRKIKTILKNSAITCSVFFMVAIILLLIDIAQYFSFSENASASISVNTPFFIFLVVFLAVLALLFTAIMIVSIIFDKSSK